GTGNAIVLHAWATNNSGCTVQGSVTIPTHTNPPPAIVFDNPTCPTTATVSNASSFTSFMWSADNADITGGWFTPSITFHPIHDGHVTITLRVYDATGCDMTAS